MQHKFSALKARVGKVIVGQEPFIERLLIGVLTGGHLLVEGLPGMAKTTAISALAAGLHLRFQRIQFTPDMIPGDVTGSDIFVPQEGAFRFQPGPIFSEAILADEINRAPPKVQSAMLEAMQEHQVTIGGVTRPLPEVFLVMATQNPIEQEGTYPLPEAQLDRFLFKVNLAYVSEAEEIEILRRHNRGREPNAPRTDAVDQGLGAADILSARAAVAAVYMDEMLERYIVALVRATRAPGGYDDAIAGWVDRGASPRAILALADAGRARAFLHGRDFVEPADLIELAPDILNHRVALSFAARADDITPRQFIARLLDVVPVP